MTSRERVFKALNHEQPDRPPMFVTLTPHAAKKLSIHLGLVYEEPLDSMLSTRISHMDLLTTLGNDCVGIGSCAPKDSPTIKLGNGIFQNEWGMKFYDTGLYYEFHQFPLAHATTVEDIQNYKFPDPFAEGRYDNAVAAVKKYKDKFIIVADLETSFFETAWYLVGLEKLLVDLISEEPYVFVLLDKIRAIHTEVGKRLIELGADILWAGDDFGGQHGMLLDPEIWRVYFKPRIKEMFQEFRKVKPDIKIAWHSCGSIIPIIPDFIEIGLDILNPIQPLATGMEPNFLKNNFGDKLCFFGGIDIQYLMPKGSPDDIKKEVTRRIDILGKDGGYIIAPAHNIQDDTSVENIMTFFNTVKNSNGTIS